jgi:hypothetical protein
LVDAAVLFLPLGDGDGILELGAGGVGVALLSEEATFENEEVGVAEVVAGFDDEGLGAGEGGLGGVQVGAVR